MPTPLDLLVDAGILVATVSTLYSVAVPVREWVIRKITGQYTWRDVGNGIRKLTQRAREIHPDYVFGIDRGGAIVGGMIVKKLGLKGLLVNILEVSKSASAQPVEHRADHANLAGKTILLVDDATHTHANMDKAYAYLTQQYPSSKVYPLVLVDSLEKPVGHEKVEHVKIDYSAFKTKRVDARLPWDLPYDLTVSRETS
jgi:hypoxanthine phosphoribosyltransferase